MMRSPNWSSKILKEETVTSTNDRLAELCQEKEIKEFTTLMAEYQTAGKGQRGNSWESEYGKNLTSKFPNSHYISRYMELKM